VRDRKHFDVVVVGSGFGGSVAAYRLAEGGLRVCVLERGKAYPPGTFARSPREMRGNFWDPSAGLHGLFNLWSFNGIDAVVSSGLGGGSLVYANVLMRMPKEWFVTTNPRSGAEERWPLGYHDLVDHYQEVERWLGATRYPIRKLVRDAQPLAAKAGRVREAARGIGLQPEAVKLAVTFESDRPPTQLGAALPAARYPNYHGDVLRVTCRLCGECNIGCNYGAKNTLDHTYLSAAAHLGAEIRVRCEVRGLLRRAGGGFLVGYVEHDPAREGKPTDTGRLPKSTITADRVVLAAGALGSPYLLLKNQSALPDLGPALGTRFSGNGDVLGLAMWGRSQRSNRDGGGIIDASRGPVITTAIGVPDALNGGDGPGYFIEDAGYPEFVNWMLELIRVPSIARRVGLLAGRRLWATIDGRPNRDIGADVSRLVGKGGLTSRSLPLLGMGRDVPDGVMRLRRRRRRQFLDIVWTSKASEPYHRRVEATMRELTEALGATYAPMPRLNRRRAITVHPLGGCPMGWNANQGVVDGFGQAFGCPGLYVADGSVMPGPIGANPALTIAAFADRMALQIVKDAAGGAR
jgi:cholesterol oxidase